MGWFGGFGGRGFGPGGFGSCWGGFGRTGFLPMGLHFLFWIAIIAVGVYLFRRWSASSKRAAYSALATLDERYARGEINTEEYKQRKKDLLS